MNSCNAQQVKKHQNNNSRAIEVLKEFAEYYHPNNKVNEPPDKLPTLTEDIKNSIYETRQSDSSAYQRYITLIILKLYRSHLECCNQTYELRQDFKLDSMQTPILFAFLDFTRLYDISRPIEFIPSSIAYKWVQERPTLLNYPPIQEEVEKIKKRKEAIDKGDF